METWHQTQLQMLHVLSYQFVDKAKQMGGKRAFHFIVNGYVQSKCHPEKHLRLNIERVQKGKKWRVAALSSK